ncbi:MAG: CotH kinase family protein [Verrucomicrobia bacterium]|nr:CotH kinase family protein [Verrucomicrobiota bacterium]
MIFVGAMTRNSRLVVGLMGLAVGAFLASAQVVINELMYHAPEDLDDLQFVELHNVGREPVDLSGWSFSKGIQFVFPSGTKIEPKGFVVVCLNTERFREFYSVPVVGEFSAKLKRSGERVELVNASGMRVDSVKYSDQAPWPMGPDGHSGSLERICPTASSENPANWISSPLSELRDKPTGTPGQVNAGYSADLPPPIQSVTFSPALPTSNQPVQVEAQLPVDAAVEEVNVWYRLAGSGFEGTEILLPMKQSAAGRYVATIPGQKEEYLIRFRVEARGTKGTRRSFPANTEPRPAFSAYVASPFTPAAIPFAWLINTREAATKRAVRSRANEEDGFGDPPGRGRRGGFRGGPFGGPPAERTPFTSAFVYFDPKTRKTELFDFVQIHERKGGHKVHFYRDQMLQEMTTIALIFEGDTAALVEPLAYEVYRRSGMPAARSQYVRVWQDGRSHGYTVLVEQPNKAFLRRNQINDDGTMYKLIWYGGDLVGQHEKHSHRRSGHEDLIQTVTGLDESTGDTQWQFIQKNFAVDEVATYFAVNMLLSHWDGFFNNYFAYHDQEGTGKWMMFPWDQDSTWGLRGGRGVNVYYTMALTFGMNGDEPPERGRGGTWRPPGWFSGPLLANPQFRQVFLRRTRQLLDTVYTEAVLGPVIDYTEKILTPEVRLRAQLLKWDPELAVQQLQYDLGRMREHLRLRREFLLSQSELPPAASNPAQPTKPE